MTATPNGTVILWTYIGQGTREPDMCPTLKAQIYAAADAIVAQFHPANKIVHIDHEGTWGDMRHIQDGPNYHTCTLPGAIDICKMGPFDVMSDLQNRQLLAGIFAAFGCHFAHENDPAQNHLHIQFGPGHAPSTWPIGT